MDYPKKSEAEYVDAGVVFAADVGGTHLRAATVDQSGTIHFRVKQNTAKSADEIVRALVLAVREAEKLKSEAAKVDHSIKSVSVVVPGTVNVEEGIVVKAPNIPCLDGFPLAAALIRELGRRAILDNDANAAAVGEMWRGAARGCRSIVCLTLGTGVGGGIILDGKLWRGADGAAAEIGHMCVEPFGEIVCGCGSRGCLEVYASATGIIRMAREASLQHPESVLKTSTQLTAKQIYEAGIEGDSLSLEVFRRMGVYLGIGLVNLINILNPEMIVIGGGVVNAWDLFEEHMHREVTARAFSPIAASFRIVRAECGDDAGLFGAARLAFANAG